jgi:hypothetical protein
VQTAISAAVLQGTYRSRLQPLLSATFKARSKCRGSLVGLHTWLIYPWRVLSCKVAIGFCIASERLFLQRGISAARLSWVIATRSTRSLRNLRLHQCRFMEALPTSGQIHLFLVLLVVGLVCTTRHSPSSFQISEWASRTLRALPPQYHSIGSPCFGCFEICQLKETPA